MKKRILSLLLTLAMLTGLLPMNILAAEGAVEVGTAQELSQALTTDQQIVLTEDLDLSQWTTPEGEFNGTLDGNGFAVTGLRTPLIDQIGTRGRVEDLTVTGADLNGSGPVGAVARTNAGEIHRVKIAAGSRIYSSGDAQVGGVAGLNTGLVSQCASQGQTAKGEGNGGAGGIVGRNSGGRVEQCSNLDAVTSASLGHGSGYIGGIVGQNDNGGTVSSSYNRGTISAGAQYSSGIVGYNKGEGADGICRDSYNAGQTEGGGNNMAVAKSGTIENCYHMDGVGQEHRGTEFVLEENADLARKLGGAFTFDAEAGLIKLLWEMGEEQDPQKEMDALQTALAGLKTITPVFGKDKNINTVMAEAVKKLIPSGNLSVTADSLSVKMTAANGLLAEDGTITYYFEEPSMEAAQGAVVENVAFEIASGDMKFPHTVTVNIPWDGMKTASALSGAAQSLTFDTIKGANTDVNEVTEDLSLPAVVPGSEWADIAWSSSSPAVDQSGKVTRQDQDTQVVLTAQVSFRGVFIQKDFTLAVPAKPMEQVTTPDELKAALGKGGSFQLGADLTLPENWSAGMFLMNDFVLDGAGHTITLNGVSLLKTDYENALPARSEVKNLVLAGTVHGNGALADSSAGTIRNCLNLADVVSADTNAGGFVGLNSAKILNSVNYGTVTGAQNMGSIVGKHDDQRGGAELSGCYGVGEKLAGSGNVAENNALLTPDTDLNAAAEALNANIRPGDAQWTVKDGRLALTAQGETPETPDPENPDPEAGLEVIEISDAKQLKAALADLWDDPSMSSQEGKKLVLTADFAIPVDMMWFATGLNTVLDGQGHVITLNNQVLLDQIGPKGQVRNLGLNGNAEGYEFKAALAAKSAGTIVNSWSRVNLKETGKLASLKMGGLVGTLQDGGVIENCYTAGTLIADGARGGLVGRAEAGSLIKNSYWKYDTAAAAAAVSEGAVENCAGKTFEDFYSQDFLELLNANRGGNMVWNPGADGYPHFGEAGHFEPVKPVEITLTYQGGKAVTFPSNKGLIVDPWDILGETNVGVLTCPEGAHWSIDYTTHGKNIMVGAESGELFIYGGGSTVITVSDKDWNKLADFTLTVPGTIQAHAMRLNVKGGGAENGRITVPGSTTVAIIPQIQQTEGGEWRDVSPLRFKFTTDDSVMLAGNAATATKPGTFVITGEGLGHTATLELTSTYAPITAIRPSPSGEYTIHERHTMVFDGRPVDFLDLNLSHQAGSVLIEPPYASNQSKEAYTFTFSAPEVADYVGDFVMGIRPLRAGTTDVTVTTTMEEQNVSGTTTITLKYLNPLTSVTVDSQDLTVKEGGKIDLPMTFTGEKSAEGYHVTEPGMDWTCSSEDGGELLIARLPNAIAVNNDKESNVANDQYYIEGITAGTVTVTGTPWDNTNGVEPVTFTVTVAPGEDVKPVDFYQMALDDSEGAAQWIVENQKGTYTYGSEWEVFTLTRSGHPLSQEQIDTYLDSVEQTYKGDRKPIDDKPTTQARVALTLTVLGQNAADFRGLDFISMLVNNPDMEAGSNEPAWALIALDSMDYAVPAGAKWTRETLIDEVLRYQAPDGGFGLFDNRKGNVDMTGMVIQALAPYYLKGEEKVVTAVNGALEYLSKTKDATCGYGSVESGAQVLTALTALGMDPLDKANGFAVRKSNLITNLHSFRHESGAFTFNGTITPMSTIQGLYAMESYIRFHDHENRLYDLTDLDPVKAEQRLTDRLESAQALESKKDIYTDESWAVLESAMAEAQRVLADEKATNDQINQADSRLAQALANLEKDPSAPENRTIYATFTLIGAEQSPEDVYLDKNQGHIAYRTWVPAMTVELPENATVYDLFVKAMEQAGLKSEGADRNYVSSVTAPEELGGYELSEMDNGRYSGWMYQLNGTFPNVGLKYQPLKDGDQVCWRYVNDYRYEGGFSDGDGVRRQTVELSPEDLQSGKAVTLAVEPIAPGEQAVIHVEMEKSGNALVRVPMKDLTPGAVVVLRDELGNYELVKYSVADESGITFRMPDSGDFLVLDWAKTFKDVSDQWYAPAAAYTSARGIFSGINDGTFLPLLEMSRGMLATVLWSLAGKPGAPVSDFKDVDRTMYYAPAIDWAASEGIITGYGDGRFGADDTLNREQLAVILYSWLDKPAVEQELNFPDRDKVSDWAVDGMEMAVAYGFMEGLGDGRLAPQVHVDRAQSAAVLMRFCEHQAA